MRGTDFASSTGLSFIYAKLSLSNQQMNGKAKNSNAVWIKSILRRDFFIPSLTVLSYFKNSWENLKDY